MAWPCPPDIFLNSSLIVQLGSTFAPRQLSYQTTIHSLLELLPPMAICLRLCRSTHLWNFDLIFFCLAEQLAAQSFGIGARYPFRKSMTHALQGTASLQHYQKDFAVIHHSGRISIILRLCAVSISMPPNQFDARTCLPLAKCHWCSICCYQPPI
jgi:hypothetical protein